MPFRSPNQQCQSTEENSKHNPDCHKENHQLALSFLHLHLSPDSGEKSRHFFYAITPTFWCQHTVYYQSTSSPCNLLSKKLLQNGTWYTYVNSRRHLNNV